MENTEQRLERELKRATEGLLFMSESDYPFKVVNFEGVDKITPDYLRTLSGQPETAPVEEVGLEEFFRVATSEPDWKGEKERANARRFQALVRLLKERLENVTVYRIGKRDKAVYIVGRGQMGQWIGLSTRVIET